MVLKHVPRRVKNWRLVIDANAFIVLCSGYIIFLQGRNWNNKAGIENAIWRNIPNAWEIRWAPVDTRLVIGFINCGNCEQRGRDKGVLHHGNCLLAMKNLPRAGTDQGAGQLWNKVRHVSPKSETAWKKFFCLISCISLPLSFSLRARFFFRASTELQSTSSAYVCVFGEWRRLGIMGVSCDSQARAVSKTGN